MAHRLDIAHGPPKLDDTHIRFLVRLVYRDVGHALDPVLHGTSNVRNNLHRFSEVLRHLSAVIRYLQLIPTFPHVENDSPWVLNHLSVDFSSCNVVIPR